MFITSVWNSYLGHGDSACACVRAVQFDAQSKLERSVTVARRLGLSRARPLIGSTLGTQLWLTIAIVIGRATYCMLAKWDDSPGFPAEEAGTGLQ